jgi:hypothetical protein
LSLEVTPVIGGYQAGETVNIASESSRTTTYHPIRFADIQPWRAQHDY